MDTVTSINWTRTDETGGTRVHTGSRAGWTFVIRTGNDRVSRLSGSHRDGRSMKCSYPTPALAKAAALDGMHPAERLAWVSDLNAGSETRAYARCGNIRFSAVKTAGGRWYFHMLRDGKVSGEPVVGITGLAEARQLAIRELESVYGPITPVGQVSAREDAVQRLETALKAAGIRYTASQLAIAVLALN